MVAGISYGRVSGFLSTIKLNVPNSSKIQNTDAVASVNNPPSNQNATSNTIVLGQPKVYSFQPEHFHATQLKKPFAMTHRRLI